MISLLAIVCLFHIKQLICLRHFTIAYKNALSTFISSSCPFPLGTRTHGIASKHFEMTHLQFLTTFSLGVMFWTTFVGHIFYFYACFSPSPQSFFLEMQHVSLLETTKYIIGQGVTSHEQ
jgi:hypothetical protein